MALEAGELDVYHIACDNHWKRKLEPEHKANLKKELGKLLARQIPCPLRAPLAEHPLR